MGTDMNTAHEPYTQELALLARKAKAEGTAGIVPDLLKYNQEQTTTLLLVAIGLLALEVGGE